MLDMLALAVMAENGYMPGSLEERYNALFNALSEGVVIQDETGRVVAFNRRAPEILGVPESALRGTTSFDPRWRMVNDQGDDLRPEDHPASLARSTGRSVVDVIGGVDTGDGEYRWLLINAVPIRGIDGAGVLVTFADITRRKNDTDRVIQNEREVRAVIDAMQVGMWIALEDQSGFSFVNDALCRLTGYSEEELLRMRGAEFLAMVSLEDLQLINSRGRSRLAGEDVSPTLEVEITRKDGVRRTFVLSGTVIQVQGLAQVLVAVTDITETRELENVRREREKLDSLAILAGGVAHDFNNKLLTVMGNATLALMDMAPDDPLRSYLEEIHRASTEAAQLSRQMLDYSGRGPFIFGEVNIREVLRSLLDDPVFRPIGTRLIVDAEQSLPPSIPGDSAQLRRLLMNVVANAFEALDDPDDSIRVVARQVLVSEGELANTYLAPTLSAGRYLLVQVSDDGHGIAPEIIDRVFDPFFSTRFPGRGLGLAGALGIVRGHGGAIHVSSEPGVGTTVSIWLPLATNQRSRRVASA